MGPEQLKGYLDTLSWQLPEPVVEELADGLEETYQRYLRVGLDLEEAAAAAVAEFGAPDVIVAEFGRSGGQVGGGGGHDRQRGPAGAQRAAAAAGPGLGRVTAPGCGARSG